MIIKLNKKSLLIVCLSFAIATAIMISVRTVPTISLSKPYTVVVDAGHGEPDGGAVGVNGTIEKDINLQIALKLQEILESRGVRVIMTREDDNSICDKSAKTLHEKKVSDMHNSFSDPSSGGLHVFYSRNHPEAEETASLIQDAMSELTGAKTHAVKVASDTLYLMKNTVPPAILIECGFISNPEEERLLNDEKYQSKIAFSIANAMIKAKK